MNSLDSLSGSVERPDHTRGKREVHSSASPVPRGAVRQGSGAFSSGSNVSSYIIELSARAGIQDAFYDRLHGAIQEAYSIDILAADALYKQGKAEIHTAIEGLDEASLQAARQAIRAGFQDGFAPLGGLLVRVEETMRKATLIAECLRKNRGTV